MHSRNHRLVRPLPFVLSLLSAAAALFIVTSVADAAEKDSRPNIILIMADDMGFECVSANGAESYQTPRLDQLAKSGFRFTDCHSQPICTPSRVQIMTGIYNNRNYIRFGYLDTRATTFAHILKSAGYKTCITGKWQLSGTYDRPGHFGFDEYCLWQLNRRPSRYVNPGLETNGKQYDYKNGEYGPDIVSDYLCDFMQRNKDQPFFAYYPMILPHWPFEPTPDSPDYDKTAKGLPGSGKNEYFDDMVSYVDKIVGKIVDKLEELEIRDNTLLIFTGDNGTFVGIRSILNGKEYPGGKGSPRDNGTHVPLIVSWPGVAKAGTVTGSLVDFSDMLPTVAEAAGATVPKDLGVDGQSFIPLLQGKPYTARDYVYCWYERNGKRGKESQHTRTEDFKLYSDGRFFNTAADMLEKKPLADDGLTAEQKQLHSKLRLQLDQHLEVTKSATEWLKREPPAKQQVKKKKAKKKKS